MPTESPALFGDALRGLADRATYLYVERDRYWYAVEPSVNRKARDLAERFLQQPEDISSAIVRRLASEAQIGDDFARVHVAPEASTELPDEDRVGLVILHPATPHISRSQESLAIASATGMLNLRGAAPRMYRNMLIFLAPDHARLDDLKRAVSNHLAWSEIVESADIHELSGSQAQQARNKQRQSDEAVRLRIPETYHWLLVPHQPDPTGPIKWSTLRVDGQSKLGERVSRKLREADFLRTVVSPRLIRLDLDGPLRRLWESGDVQVSDLWDAYARYCYLPRLRDENVLHQAVALGPAGPNWKKQGFAVAGRYDMEEGRYANLVMDVAPRQ
jgi:hypothetical protein